MKLVPYSRNIFASRKTDRGNEHNSVSRARFINKLFKLDHRSVYQLSSSRMTKGLIMRDRCIRCTCVFVQTFAYLYARTSRLHNYRELIRAASFETDSWEGTAVKAYISDRYYFRDIRNLKFYTKSICESSHTRVIRVVRMQEKIFLFSPLGVICPISILSEMAEPFPLRSGKHFRSTSGTGRDFNDYGREIPRVYELAVNS